MIKDNYSHWRPVVFPVIPPLLPPSFLTALHHSLLGPPVLASPLTSHFYPDSIVLPSLSLQPILNLIHFVLVSFLFYPYHPFS